jgi:hypothetical protein
VEEQQQKIALIDAQSRLMMQRANQYVMGGPEEQSAMTAEAIMQMQNQPLEGEEEVMAAEEEMEEPVIEE